MSLSVGVREPLPRLRERVEDMVRAAGHEVAVRPGDADVLLVCLDSPAGDWDPFEKVAELPVIASAVREAAVADVRTVGELQRPFNQASLTAVLDRAAMLLDRTPLEAAATEIAESIDVFAGLADPEARTEAVLTVLRSHLGGE